MISSGFDNCGIGFSGSNCETRLTDLCFIDNGTCAGFSVGQVLDAANYLIGDCRSLCTTTGNLPQELCSLSLSDMNSCVDTLNNAFDDGTKNSGKIGTCASIVETSKNQGATNDAHAAAYCASLVLFSALVAWF